MAKKERFDLVIVGSGPGGYVAAVRAARLGLKTACVEKAPRLGGICLNSGCIPSKALLDSSRYFHLAKAHLAEHGIKTGRIGLDLAAMMARKDRVVSELTDNVRKLLERNRIRILHGTAALSGAHRVEVSLNDGKENTQTLEADAILLATGSEPAPLPGMAFDGQRIVSAAEALAFDRVPKHLGIVGGGYIGLELGSVWLRLGAKVTVLEMLPRIAPAMDAQVARTLDRLLKRQGMEIRVKTAVKEAAAGAKSVKVTVETDGRSETLNVERLLVAVGRKPLTRGLNLEQVGVQTDPKTGFIIIDSRYRTSVPSIYAIGDLVPGPMLAHKASAEGIAAVECIAGRPGEVDYDTIPSIIYTHPEAASVGLTEEEAKRRQIPCCVGSYPFLGTGRARCMGETDGFVKLVVQADTDRLLGAHIIGPRASDMIAECVTAMVFGASSEDLARTVHGHPTFAEALQEAAMAARKCSIYAF